MGVLEDKLGAQRNPKLETNKNVRLGYDRRKHWRETVMENRKENGKNDDLKWKVCKKRRRN